MLKIIDKSLIYDFLANDEKLVKYGLDYASQQEIASGEWDTVDASVALGYYHEGELASIIHLECLTEATVVIHWYCASKYWGTGLTRTIVQSVESWIKEHTAFISAIIYIPFCCEVTLAAVKREDFIMTGVIPCGIIWKQGMPENLAIMHKLLIREINE